MTPHWHYRVVEQTHHQTNVITFAVVASAVRHFDEYLSHHATRREAVAAIKRYIAADKCREYSK